MDNLLAQVTGRKRVVLFSPQDALHLYLSGRLLWKCPPPHDVHLSNISFDPSGDKSEVLDIDSPDLDRFPDFVKARRWECVLEPGDLLFIPGKRIRPQSERIV